MTRKQRKMLIRIAVSLAATVLLNLIPISGVPRLVSFAAVYLLIGYDILRKALLGIFNGRVFDENFLMAIATVGAFALAIYDGSGDYNEAVAVMLFYQTGELFQSCAVGRSRKSISSLMDIRPDYANVEQDGSLLRVDPAEVAVGSIITVQPGEKIPIDGVVVEGVSSLDTAALTGESLPRSISEGEMVISGCINLSGVIRVRTTKQFGESTVQKILELVENATSKKSKSEKFISKFAKVYTPSVCLAALALAVLPPLVIFLASGSAPFAAWIYRALTFLVISCPCALVISIPLSFFAGIGGAGREGILIKGSNYVETFARVECVVFDKTGTLTEGTFEVSEIISEGLGRQALLDYAAHAECASTHPIGKSVIRAYSGEIDRTRVAKIEEISGMGVLALVDGIPVGVGNGALMKRLGIEYAEQAAYQSALCVAVDKRFAGYIVISDTVKKNAKDAISSLRSLGVKKTVMLTGDSEAVAKTVANLLGVDEYKSRLLPQDKVSAVEALLASSPDGGKLAFVGDGIHDAPVLARADIGIAMGAMGSDAAIEAADIVLMNDDPEGIAKAVKICRRCIGIVKQNTIFSLAVKFACLALVAAGVANMWFGIFADVGVMVLAVLNAARAFKTK